MILYAFSPYITTFYILCIESEFNKYTKIDARLLLGVLHNELFSLHKHKALGKPLPFPKPVSHHSCGFCFFTAHLKFVFNVGKCFLISGDPKRQHRVDLPEQQTFFHSCLRLQGLDLMTSEIPPVPDLHREQQPDCYSWDWG